MANRPGNINNAPQIHEEIGDSLESTSVTWTYYPAKLLL